MYRNKSFDELVAENLKKPGAAQDYLLTLMEGEDGLSLEDALRHTVKAMGVKEYCACAKLSMPNVVRFLNTKRSLKTETLEKYLKPFGLKARIIAVKAA